MVIVDTYAIATKMAVHDVSRVSIAIGILLQYILAFLYGYLGIDESMVMCKSGACCSLTVYAVAE